MEISGKKTYTLGIIILLIALGAKYFNVIDGQTATMLISFALLALGLKSGQAKLLSHQ